MEKALEIVPNYIAHDRNPDLATSPSIQQITYARSKEQGRKEDLKDHIDHETKSQINLSIGLCVQRQLATPLTPAQNQGQDNGLSDRPRGAVAQCSHEILPDWRIGNGNRSVIIHYPKDLALSGNSLA